MTHVSIGSLRRYQVTLKHVRIINAAINDVNELIIHVGSEEHSKRELTQSIVPSLTKHANNWWKSTYLLVYLYLLHCLWISLSLQPIMHWSSTVSLKATISLVIGTSHLITAKQSNFYLLKQAGYTAAIQLLGACTIFCLCPQSHFWVLIYQPRKGGQVSWLLAHCKEHLEPCLVMIKSWKVGAKCSTSAWYGRPAFVGFLVAMSTSWV